MLQLMMQQPLFHPLAFEGRLQAQLVLPSLLLIFSHHFLRQPASASKFRFKEHPARLLRRASLIGRSCSSGSGSFSFEFFLESFKRSLSCHFCFLSQPSFPAAASFSFKSRFKSSQLFFYCKLFCSSSQFSFKSRFKSSQLFFYCKLFCSSS